MKFSAAFILAMSASASAFTTPSVSKANALRMADMPTEESAIPAEVPAEPVKPVLPKMSESLPFALRPAALDGSMVGDVGFDPLGFAKTKGDLLNYREAEIKHARYVKDERTCW